MFWGLSKGFGADLITFRHICLGLLEGSTKVVQVSWCLWVSRANRFHPRKGSLEGSHNSSIHLFTFASQSLPVFWCKSLPSPKKVLWRVPQLFYTFPLHLSPSLLPSSGQSTQLFLVSSVFWVKSLSSPKTFCGGFPWHIFSYFFICLPCSPNSCSHLSPRLPKSFEMPVSGSLERSHSAAPFSSCHVSVGTMTRLRLLQFRPTWQFPSAASLAQPFRATMAFSQSDGSSHFHKDGVNVSSQQLVMPPAGAGWRRQLQALWARVSVKELHVVQVSSKSSSGLLASFYGQQQASKRRGKS